MILVSADDRVMVGCDGFGCWVELGLIGVYFALLKDVMEASWRVE